VFINCKVFGLEITTINQHTIKRRTAMQKGEHLVIIGCGGVGGPAAMMSRKLMPDIKITVIREEKRFIVR
jgi:D-arabinose 1-dehydrogenase-like Zn-dependent alcohol dehydrogenase